MKKAPRQSRKGAAAAAGAGRIWAVGSGKSPRFHNNLKTNTTQQSYHITSRAQGCAAVEILIVQHHREAQGFAAVEDPSSNPIKGRLKPRPAFYGPRLLE